MDRAPYFYFSLCNASPHVFFLFSGQGRGSRASPTPLDPRRHGRLPVHRGKRHPVAGLKADHGPRALYGIRKLSLSLAAGKESKIFLFFCPFYSQSTGEGPGPDGGDVAGVQRVAVVRRGVLAQVRQRLDEEGEGRSM